MTSLMRRLEREAAKEKIAKQAERDRLFMWSGGVCYCRTHGIPAQWLGRGPSCWKCTASGGRP
jgi:hypothetical protein